MEIRSIGGKTNATSDEELAAYEDRRNGIGAHFVPMVMQAKQQQQLEHQQMHRNSNHKMVPVEGNVGEEDSGNLNITHALFLYTLSSNQILDRIVLTINDPPLAIVQFMAKPNSGLLVKDRKWLKIPIPMSFIGHELVNWLIERVQGFESRKQARLFANRLLELGLIKHAVNMNRFSEKCYYKFDGLFSLVSSLHYFNEHCLC